MKNPFGGGMDIFWNHMLSIVRLKGAHNSQGITTQKARQIDLLLSSCNKRLFLTLFYLFLVISQKDSLTYNFGFKCERKNVLT